MWESIVPNEKHDWINQRDDAFDTFISLGDKKDKDSLTIFDDYSLGLGTNRDAWCYNFSKKNLVNNMARMIEFYNKQVDSYKERKEWDKEITVDVFVDNDPTKISWSSSLKSFFERLIKSTFSDTTIRTAMYRPFCKNHVYYDKHWVHRLGQMPRIFPEPGMENVIIGLCGKGGIKDFSPLIHNVPVDLNLQDAGTQCFPLYTYEPVNATGLWQDRKNGRGGQYVKKENISDTMLQKFQEN